MWWVVGLSTQTEVSRVNTVLRLEGKGGEDVYEEVIARTDHGMEWAARAVKEGGCQTVIGTNMGI